MNRVDIASFDELLSASRRSLLDGFIAGQPIANVIGGILSVASAFGGDEADRGAHPIATTPIETFDELKREAVAEAVDNLFAGSKLDSIVRNACVLGMAFGFKNVRAKQNAA